MNIQSARDKNPGQDLQTLLIRWGDLLVQLDTDCLDMLPQLQVEAGGLLLHGAGNPDIRLSVFRGNKAYQGQERVQADVDPDALAARIRLRGPFSADEQIMMIIAYAAVLIRHAWMKRRGHVLHMHAAAVVHNDRAMLLCGPTGMGKTTFTAALVQQGWTYLSDEDAIICDHQAVPLPRALRLSNQMAEQLALEARPYLGFYGDRGMCWTCPESYQLTPASIGSIVWLSQHDQPAPALMPSHRKAMLMHLLWQCHKEAMDDRDTMDSRQRALLDYNRQILPTLEGLMADTPLYTLSYAPGDCPRQAAALLEEIHG